MKTVHPNKFNNLIWDLRLNKSKSKVNFKELGERFGVVAVKRPFPLPTPPNMHHVN